MSDTGDSARTGLRAQFEQEALRVGMERQRLEREKEIVKARATAAGSGVRSSQLGRVVECQGLIHELDVAMHQPNHHLQQQQQQQQYTPARPASSSAHSSAYPPPETPQSHHLNAYPSSTLSGADSSNIRAPTSDLFGMGDVSRIPAAATTSTAHATPTAATATTASNVWTTPLSAMHAGSGVLGSTPQSPGMALPSQQAPQGYVKPVLRGGGADQQMHLTPVGRSGAARQVKISPQSVAYFASSTGSGSGSMPGQAHPQQHQLAAVQVPTVLGLSTSTASGRYR
ncbi:hypothetical protein BCR44DRAFT_1454005 [Catenaria anguillulae PL171]|uniref:Uncharacterized protein n=1 Tax=Catenaria anguillulae PL171 TaxID=765915 RepID=A0A1Y2H830_9FUNG|nr:hypothetical protein BCR44DRAFT_1454005 [Catenaria anguillulae PL171]